MAIRKHLCLIVSLFLLIPHSLATETVVKAGYWFPASEFPVSDINSTLFTHLFCAFAGIDPQTNQVNISSTDRVAFSTFTQTVQQKNPDVKTLLSIGGGSSTLTSEYLATMVSQPASRKIFINSSITRARENGFHGLDLDWDWKYPETAEKMANMGTFFDEWRDSVATESRDSGMPELILTAAVYYSARFNSNTYPINSIERSLDWVNVMAYDFSAPGWSHNYTGPPAALYNPTGPVSTSSGINAWIGNGLSSNKILLGLPFYGYAWKLLDPKNHIVGAPANGSALSEDGSQTYKQIKEFIGKTGATLVHDEKMVMDYCYIGSTWIGFDDLKTIAKKVTYVKEKGLRGYYGWSVSADDNWALALKGALFITFDKCRLICSVGRMIAKLPKLGSEWACLAQLATPNT